MTEARSSLDETSPRPPPPRFAQLLRLGAPGHRAAWVMALIGLAAGSAGCTALLGLDDKTYDGAGSGAGAASTGGAGGGNTGGAGGGGVRNPGDTLWARTSSNSSVTQPAIGGVAVDSSSRIWVTGAFQTNLQLEGCRALMADNHALFVARFALDGTCEYAEAYGGATKLTPGGVAINADDDLLAVGTFATALTLPLGALTTSGDQDLFVLKIRPNGDVHWGRQFGGSGNDHGSAIATHLANRIVVAGSYSDSVTVGTTGLTSGGMTDILLFEMDARGGVDWAKGFGSAGAEVAGAVAISANGNVGFTGTAGGSLDLMGVQINPASNNVFAAVINANATMTLWAHASSEPGPSDGLAVAFDEPNLNLFVGGSFDGNLALNGVGLSTAAMSRDGFVALVGTGMTRLQGFGQGNPLMAPDDEVAALALAPPGDLVFAGTCRELSAYRTTLCMDTGTGAGIAVAKVPKDLLTSSEPAWLRRFGDHYSNRAHAVALDLARGEVIVAGEFDGNVEFEPERPIVAEFGEIFIMKLKL